MKRNETDKLFENLPACAADFIKLVIKKMRYRKKVRREVLAELAAHFEDELSGCKTSDEKEQKAQQLINEFGDAKLLGVLLRRAKKRCRPLWRTVVARTFQTAGVIIVCFILYVVWFLTGKPVITTDYVAELNRIVRPAADESLNAAPLYHKAAKLYEKLPDDISKLLGKKYEEVTPEEKQLIEKWLTDSGETLELVIAGTQKPYYWQKYKESEGVEGMMSVLLPHLAGFRRMAWTLRWRIWLSVEQGWYEAAFDDIKSCYRLGQHLRGNKTLIEQLVGIAIEALVAQTIRDIISQYQIDSSTLAKLQQDFEQMIADEDFAINLKTEKLFMYDEIQRCFTEDRLGGGHISLEALKRMTMYYAGRKLPWEGPLREVWTAPLHVLFTHPNKQESREMADRCYAFWEEIARKSPARIHAEAIDIEKETMEIIKGNILLEIIAPAFGNLCKQAHGNKTSLEAALTIVAILRYGQDVGGYPENFDELIETGYLKKLPMDPWSNKPLVYKKTDDGFILYSIGEDFKDDGGQVYRDHKGKVRHWADEGDWVFWPVPKSQIKQ